jgi:hypothetical protein
MAESIEKIYTTGVTYILAVHICRSYWIGSEEILELKCSSELSQFIQLPCIFIATCDLQLLIKPSLISSVEYFA